MKTGISSIQCNRTKWLCEWLDLNHSSESRNFYIYLYIFVDNFEKVSKNLHRFSNINFFLLIADVTRPQLSVYDNCYQTFVHEIDWMAFHYGKKSFFSENHSSLKLFLEPYNYNKLSSIDVFEKYLGISFHMNNPNDIIMEDYLYSASYDLSVNLYKQYIIKINYDEQLYCLPSYYFFDINFGKLNQYFRIIIHGFFPKIHPIYDFLQINHYIFQRRKFFINFNRFRVAADAGSSWIRNESWWETQNRSNGINREFHQFLPNLNHQLLNILELLKMDYFLMVLILVFRLLP